jgi:hypothetical protein
MVKGDKTVSVPCHNTDMGVGLYKALLKQTGLKE